MAFALYICSESGDDYVFAFDGEPTVAEITEKVWDRMGDEIGYIGTWEHDATYNIDFDKPFGSWVKEHEELDEW